MPQSQNLNANLALIKREILKDFKQRVDDKIMENENYDLLEKLINKAENEKEVLDIAALGTKWLRTGFHFDVRLEKTGNEISYFKKNENLSFINNENALTHKLIIGDNYPALQNLLITYREKIKVIYIDPPYGKDDMGEFAKTNYKNTITRDNLLSMLKARLILAKMLLRDDGVIFCSIDDKNQAYVKCLFDEIFGEWNFISTLHIELSTTQGMKVAAAQKGQIVKNAEYILVYAKNIESFNFERILYTTKEWDDHYSVYINPKTKQRDTLLSLKALIV